MGRRSDPKGKDRPRTIVLSGDVAEIAQKLADKSELSSTLSELLRQTYGFGDAIEAKKIELQMTTDERQRLQHKEEDLIAVIDAMEAEKINKKATLYPQLKARLETLTERRLRVQHEASIAVDSYVRGKKLKVLDTIQDLIDKTTSEMEEYK
jgi:hypothetical protein